jgi:hypothetical protein
MDWKEELISLAKWEESLHHDTELHLAESPRPIVEDPKKRPAGQHKGRRKPKQKHR